LTLLCGWLQSGGPAAGQPSQEGQEVIAAMGAALRVHSGQAWAFWRTGALTVGLLELPGEPVERVYAPAVTPDGRWHLWMAGEAFDGGRILEGVTAVRSRTAAFREALLAALLRHGLDAVREMDGEYQIVLWDRAESVLTLLNDRFGGLPLYWGRAAAGFAFAGGVRGVLAAPGISADPDLESIREAVTFGGYRLGDRTNAAAVKMVAGATVVTVRAGEGPVFRRSWSWSDIPEQPDRPVAEWIEQAHELWRRAIRRRLDGSSRPGQTLSGGLDSRAILAEAVLPREPASPASRWTALTYGLPGCDDAIYARRAAETAGVTWVFHPLYSGRDPDWLERRTGYVQATDGLIDLVDLMHLETLPLQASLLDLHLSGYIGDAVAGPTFNDVTDSDGVLVRLPYYGGRLGLSWEAARVRAEAMVGGLNGAPARFALFEHKLPQATNRWTAAWRPWFRVRKPFTDYAFFDFFQGLPGRARGALALYERWLRARYPQLFATIPNQKTGVPVLSPPWRLQTERARRYAWRQAQPRLARLGLPARPRLRAYSDDETVWKAPEIRRRIEAVIRRPGSVAGEVFGRADLERAVAGWFEHNDTATQVVAALYVYESYHQGLPEHLRAARAACDAPPLPAASR
jgi:hypothetical protein